MEDEVPFEVIDFPETGNLSGQTGGDVIEPARSIRFRIENVEPRTFKKEGFLMTAKLNVRCAVGPLGVDGNGKYAGKNLFAELLTWFNEAVYTSEWWRKQSRFPYSRFLKALGFDISNPPKINDDFFNLLKGKEFIADIRKNEMTKKNESGEYVGTGDYKNELSNFKPVL